eukprot:SAG31_NODE_115_length_24128_cov_47.693912_4_plen_1815_part_00
MLVCIVEQGYPQDYVVCVAGAAMAVLFVVLGVPLYTWVEIRRRAATLRSVPVPGPVSVAIANELELDGGSAAAVELMVQVELVSEYGFLVDAFRPGCETWELFDMLRKMVLIGLLTVCVPGSLFQLWVTSLVALCFLAAHFKKWPYKLQADNILKALAESLIFITVLFGLILDNPELEDEPISEPHYDYALIGCYAVLPCGFLLAVSKKNVWLTELSRAHKSSIEEAGLSMATSAAAAIRYAHHLHEAGLGTEKDRAMLRGLFAAAAVRVEAEKLESLAKEIIGDDNHAGLDIVDHGQKEEGQRLEANAVTFRWRPLGPPQPLPANVGDDRVATAEPTHNEALQEHAAGSQATAVTQSGATFNADGHQVVQIKGRNWEVVSWPYDGYVQLKCKSMKKRFSLAELADLGIEILGRTKAKAIALAGPRTKLTNLVNTINTDEMSSNANGGPAHSGGDAQEVLDDHKPIQDRCHKFTDGFEASFADAEFLIGTHASLDRLIGPPHLDVEIAVKDEHCAVTSGFGASDTEVEASSYHQLRFTPRKEYAFVMNTSSSDAGEEEEQGRVRVQVSIDHLLHHAAERINAAFSRMGWTADGAVTQIQLDSLRMQRSELVALRLATGPMFVLYNTVLRAAFAGGGVVVQGSPFAGQDTKGRFITTIHAINSGIVKLRSLQPACNVYRAVSGSQLPPPFVDGSGSGLAAMLGFKVAVEPGFVAATVHKTIAVKDATGQDETIAKRNNVVLLECRMGLLSRGAFIGWLSQYPTEAEVLLPPVCALEMLQQPSPQSTADGSQTYAMQLHASLKPLTLEQVRAVRQKQCSELAGLVSKDLTNQVPIGDVPSRQEAMRKLAANIVAEADPGVFQENSKFFETTEAVLAQLPRPGDHLTTLWPHRRPVFALAAGLRSGGGGPVLLSGSWDSTTAEFGREPTTTAASEAFEKPTARGSAVLSLALLPGYALAAIGMLNGTVEIISAGGSGREERPPVKLSGHGGPVLALAWLGSRRWLACGSATGVIIWELSRDEPSWSVRWRVGQGEGTVKSLCWTHAAAGRPWLTIATLAGGATLWDIGLTTMDVRPKLKLACRSPVTSMADLGRQLATGTAGRTIVIWALTDSVSRDSPTASVGIKAGAELAKQLHAHGSGVTALAGLSGARLASGGADNLVKLWALPDNVGRLVHLTTLAGHDGPVYALAVLEAEGWLASGGGDGSVRLWRVAERRLADPEAALLLAGASDDTAARKVTAQDRKQVDAIFDWLNHADGSGFVKCGMMQKLAGVTGGELSADDFALICDLTGCDPRQGLSKAGLLSCYTELSLGDLNEDYRLLGLDRSSISGQMTAMRAASKMLKGRDTRSHATEQQNLDAVAEAGAHVELPIIPRLPAVDVSPVQTKFKKAALVAAAAAESTDLTGHYLNEDKELADPAKRPVRDEPIVSEMSDIPPLRLSPATSENSRETEDHSGLLPPAAVTEETAGVDHDMSNEIDEDNDAAAVTKETAADVYDVSDEIDEDDHAASTLACELEGPAFCQFHGKGDFVPVFALLKAGGQLKLLEHVSGGTREFPALSALSALSALLCCSGGGCCCVRRLSHSALVASSKYAGSEIASASVLGCKVGKPKKSRKGYTDALRIDMAARSDGELGPAQPAAKCIVHFECERGRWFTELDKYAGMTDDDALAEVAAHAAASAAASPRAAKMSPRASHAARKRAAGQLESAAQCQLNGEGAFIEMRAELHEDPQNSQLGVSWLVLKDADNGRPFFAGSVLGCRVAKPRSRRVGHERALRLDMGNGANAKKLVIEFDSVLEERWTSELKQLGGMSRVRK